MKPLNPEQAAAVETLLPALRTGGIGSLIGPAGSGKSFTLGDLLRQACASPSHQPSFAASAACLSPVQLPGRHLTSSSSWYTAPGRFWTGP